MVFRKLLSTLALFFIKFHSTWPLCIPSVISTLSGNLSTVGADDISLVLQKLGERQLVFSLEFCQILVEEVQGGKLTSINETNIKETLVTNIKVLSVLLNYSCQMAASTVVLEQAIETYAAWCLIDSGDKFSQFTMFMFSLLENGRDEHILEKGIEGIASILEKNPRFYSEDLKTRLAQILVNMGRPLIDTIIQKNNEISGTSIHYIYSEDSDIDSLESFAKDFSKLTIALCESELRHPDRLNSKEISTLFDYLLVISNFPGVPYVDHTLTMDILEFWSAYTDYFDESSEVAESNPIILHVIEVFWNKSAYPLEKSGWDHDSREAFDSFRRDFWDFLEMSYHLIGSPLFLTFTSNIVGNLSSESVNWLKIEASLSCITSLADDVPTTDEYDHLFQLLSSGILSKLDQVTDMDVRMTAVGFVGAYDSFFELDRGKQFLFSALDYLFKSLTISTLAHNTSRSIQKLCSSNRSFLSSNLQDFFQTYTTLRLYEQLENIPHQRTVLAISFIIQSISDLETKASYTSKLLGLIINELELEFQKFNTTSDDESLDRIISLLKCVASVGKGLQEPDDVPDVKPGETFEQETFWNNDGYNIRSKVIDLITIFSIQRNDLKSSAGVNEACCEIFKSGFLEKIPGPFVFNPDTILEFIKAKYSHFEIFSLIVDFSCSFVTSCAVKYSNNTSIYVNSLINMFFSTRLDILDNDPEAQTAYLKLHVLIAQQHMDTFLTNSNSPYIIQFALTSFSSQERFVLRESSRFWVTFIKANQEKVPQLLSQIGQDLVDILVKKISGDSVRSELDYYIDVIKQLMSKHSYFAKPWLEKSLVKSPSSSLEKIALSQRNRLLQQLVSLRGARETNNVIKDYWLSASGITDYM